MNLFVICLRPGVQKFGWRHPPVAEYPAARFSAEQLREMLGDADFVLIRGARVTADTLAAAAPPPDAPARTDGERVDAAAETAASADATAQRGAVKNPARARHGKAA